MLYKIFITVIGGILFVASAAPTVPEPRRIDITAKRFSYTPDQITLKKGEPVVLVFHTQDGGVEMWRGGLGSAYLLPALSSAGASLSGPCSVSTSRSSNRTCLSQASGSRRRLTQLPKAIACDAVCDSRKQLGSLQAHRQSPFLRRFLRPPSTRAPSLHRRYPASSVLRAPPPSQSARICKQHQSLRPPEMEV